ncbi:MAG: hypothetical protein A3K77_00720 [Euryarchaeota archaeon RBG_13_31_8]|nr:MAG: hypothetical protein A3K77_00720 [Euryarchaeota archaeon RBG_13_31_8]
MPDRYGKRSDFVIEAWEKGITKQFYKQNHTPKTKIDIAFIECSLESQQNFYRLLEEHLGKKYDFFAILGFVTRTHIESKSKFFCSEFVCQCLYDSGIKILNNIKSYKVSPGCLYTSPLLNLEEIIYT